MIMVARRAPLRSRRATCARRWRRQAAAGFGTEWREQALDPESATRLPMAGYYLHVIVFCSEGYTSSLAAAALLDLGIRRAADLAGGFRAWRASGLPVTASLGA